LKIASKGQKTVPFRQFIIDEWKGCVSVAGHNASHGDHRSETVAVRALVGEDERPPPRFKQAARMLECHVIHVWAKTLIGTRHIRKLLTGSDPVPRIKNPGVVLDS
jgi:hypothetical protein